MKKWMAMLMLGTSMLVFASGCGNDEIKTTPQVTSEATPEATPEEVTPQQSEEAPVQIENKKETITKVQEADYLNGLNLYNSYTLALANENIAIELYVAAEVDPATGEAELDDGQEWTLVARQGDDIYPLVERTYIQNGQVGYTVYTDYEQNEMPHILAEVSSGAGISYYDCTYDEASKTFSREVVLEANNINVLYKN